MTPSDLKRVITELGFNGDAFSFMGSIDITPLDIGKLATFDMNDLPAATVVIKMSPDAMNNLVAVMVTMVKSIMFALAAPTLIAVDTINGLLLKTKTWMVKAENDLITERNKIAPAQRWLDQKTADLNSWHYKVAQITNQYYAHVRQANMACRVTSYDCLCSEVYWYFEWNYECLKCLTTTPSGCVGAKAKGALLAAADLIVIGVRETKYWAADKALKLAKAAINIYVVVIDAILEIVQIGKKVIDWVYDGFKFFMTPLVGICNLLKVNCMVNGELDTAQVWGLFRHQKFDLFKVEYFQVTGTFDPKKPASSYSYKMPVQIFNERHDLHGRWTLDPASLIEDFFTTIWK